MALMALGALLNVVIAWAAAIWSELGPGAVSPASSGIPESDETPPLVWRAPVPTDWPAPSTVSAAHGVGIAAQFGWAAKIGSATVIRAGWPFPSLRSAHIEEPAQAPKRSDWVLAGPKIQDRSMELVVRSSRVIGTVALAPGKAPVPNVIVNARTMTIARRLPLVPLWPGFLANSVCGALLIYGVWRVLPAGRRAARRRRGLCAWCGYSRAGLPEGGVCPECGAENQSVRPRRRIGAAA